MAAATVSAGTQEVGGVGGMMIPALGSRCLEEKLSSALEAFRYGRHQPAAFSTPFPEQRENGPGSGIACVCESS